MKAEDLVRGGAHVRRKVAFLAEERPVGIQLYGSDPATMAEAARAAAALGPDFLDLNCGCWVKKRPRCSQQRVPSVACIVSRNGSP